MTSGVAARCAERLRLSVIGARYRPHSRRRKVLPPAARMRRKRGAIGRKGAAFPHSRGAKPLKHRDLSLIWTALGLPRRISNDLRDGWRHKAAATLKAADK